MDRSLALVRVVWYDTRRVVRGTGRVMGKLLAGTVLGVLGWTAQSVVMFALHMLLMHVPTRVCMSYHPPALYADCACDVYAGLLLVVVLVVMAGLLAYVGVACWHEPPCPVRASVKGWWESVVQRVDKLEHADV